jgi:MFS family permease
MIDRSGGRGLLALSALVFALGLALLAIAASLPMLFLAWAVIGVGMGIGLYESAFSTLAGIYGAGARSPITGITLIAGFASTVSWPLTAWIEAEQGWRIACWMWVGAQILIALPLAMILPPGTQTAPASDTASDSAEKGPPRLAYLLLGFVFAVTWFNSTAMAAHLPRLLEAAGASTTVAVAAGALIGPAQVGARMVEFGLLRNMHPLVIAKLAAIAHPVGAGLLMATGGIGAYAFALLHGAGNGILTIAKGTLPLALFGPVGYGLRQGLLNAPARALQAAAPLAFGFALERLGAHAIWLTSALALAALAALFALGRIARQT